jgi:leucine-rich repeat protein SHOC2
LQLTALSPALGKLGQLTRCDLSNNQITTLPLEIGQLSSLSSLVLSQNFLESLPPTISSTRSLPRVSASQHRALCIRMKPEATTILTLLWCTDLTLLEVLDLQNNKLTELSKEIGQLCSLLVQPTLRLLCA